MKSSQHSFLNFSNSEEINRLYENYLKDPENVDPSFIHFFQGLAYQGLKEGQDSNESKISKLIAYYRKFGHLYADLNPVAINRKQHYDLLALDEVGLKEDDLNLDFPTLGALDANHASLQKIIDRLKQVYCNTLGVECEHLENEEIKKFIYDNLENTFQTSLPSKTKIDLLEELNKAEAFEAFIQLRYPGQKRFSIEGGESFLPLMQQLLSSSKDASVKEVVVGMAHRGRLNFLANIMKKPYEEIFSEFETKSKISSEGLSGDVKYHKGAFLKENGLEITLLPNPSHLEAVDAVVLGRARAKALKRGNVSEVLPIAIHGDASISGQGIVYETLQMENLEGFQTGGVLHLVINNQIGFTAKTEESRSTLYCSDIAKAFGLPIFHVNSEDLILCSKIASLAISLRQKFGLSVFIDFNCYRKYGHNETDEPRFTHPKLYDVIQAKRSLLDGFSEKLLNEGIISEDALKLLKENFKKTLTEAHGNVQEFISKKPYKLENEPAIKNTNTALPEEILSQLIKSLSELPKDFQVHPKLKRLIEDRKSNFEKSKTSSQLDFATCEQLAYASLLQEGTPIRIVGEDSRRGTFAHRHAVLVDQVTEDIYYQLNHLSENQSRISVYNSFLSEYAAMGYEYGYSVESIESLVIWEAQFGDFANCAQVVIDQFLAAGYQKWAEQSSLVLFLPHGYEGMGPEHSSARIERFMQLAAQNNIEIIYPTRASQMFHLLRHQVKKQHKTPMIVLAPKALLRAREAYSSVQDLTLQGFQDFIEDGKLDPSLIQNVVFSIGKLNHELRNLDQSKMKNTALVSIERLYPINESQLVELMSKYYSAKTIVLCQEEPMNMGAIKFFRELFERLFPNMALKFIARDESASTAVGSSVLHQIQQERLINKILEAL